MIIIQRRVRLEKINALKRLLVMMMTTNLVSQIAPMEKENNNFFGKLQGFVTIEINYQYNYLLIKKWLVEDVGGVSIKIKIIFVNIVRMDFIKIQIIYNLNYQI